jgi:hypothetical protein
MSLAGWGVDAVEDTAAAAFGVCTHTLGWGLQKALSQPALQDVLRVLPQGWVDRLGLRREVSAVELADEVARRMGLVRVGSW